MFLSSALFDVTGFAPFAEFINVSTSSHHHKLGRIYHVWYLEASLLIKQKTSVWDHG